MENIDLSPTDYGYCVDEDDHLVHEILDGDKIPSDFPSPCNCLKCQQFAHAGSSKLGAVNFVNVVLLETARTLSNNML